MFHIIYQNGSKILSIETSPWGRNDLGTIGMFLKLIMEWIKRRLAQLQSI